MRILTPDSIDNHPDFIRFKEKLNAAYTRIKSDMYLPKKEQKIDIIKFEGVILKREGKILVLKHLVAPIEMGYEKLPIDD